MYSIMMMRYLLFHSITFLLKPHSFLLVFTATLEATRKIDKDAEQHGSRVVLLAFTNRALLRHADHVAEASQNPNAESYCDLAAAGFAPVAVVPRGFRRLVSFPKLLGFHLTRRGS
jgi:hypothetical protein